MFDFKPLWDNLSTQAIILLSILALALIIVGIVTQGFARTIVTVIGIFVLIALILMLANAEDVGTWIKDRIFNPNASMIVNQWKGVFRNGI
ncbi:TPA: hypothetical protein QFF48_001628 [Enterococcus faecium]